jgi:hypothetical protein
MFEHCSPRFTQRLSTRHKKPFCEDRTTGDSLIAKLPIDTRFVLSLASHLGRSSRGQVRQVF